MPFQLAASKTVTPAGTPIELAVGQGRGDGGDAWTTIEIRDHGPGIDPAHLDPAIDMVVRVVLSHVMQPSSSPEKTGDDIAWIAGRVLAG